MNLISWGLDIITPSPNLWIIIKQSNPVWLCRTTRLNDCVHHGKFMGGILSTYALLNKSPIWLHTIKNTCMYTRAAVIWYISIQSQQCQFDFQYSVDHFWFNLAMKGCFIAMRISTRKTPGIQLSAFDKKRIFIFDWLEHS